MVTTPGMDEPPPAPGGSPRVAIVTGGARGIGARLSTAFAEDGTAVVIADVHQDGEALATLLRDRGQHAEFVRTNVASERSAAELAEHCARRYGRIDVLVNNAGRYRELGTKRPFTEISVEEWDQVFAVMPMTRAIAREVGEHGITVNAVAPGFVDNEASRAVNDPEYAEAAARRHFLCSDTSAFITGQTIVVDGGTAFS
jgi:NAD(P)-dependent dehydrogenase (short-subunit alcohol dehydrogenase family)